MRKGLVLAFVAIALAVAGCAQVETPTLSPTPTTTATPEQQTPAPSPTTAAVRPTLNELVAYPGGLDYVKVGVPVDERDPEASIITYNGASCSDSEPNRVVGWESSYEASPFRLVTNPDGTVRGIMITDDAIRTAKGIGVGSSRAEVVAAYPTALLTSNAATDTYSITGPDGVLNIELATSRDSGELRDRIDTVLWMVATTSEQAGAYYAYGEYGPCI